MVRAQMQIYRHTLAEWMPSASRVSKLFELFEYQQTRAALSTNIISPNSISIAGEMLVQPFFVLDLSTIHLHLFAVIAFGVLLDGDLANPAALSCTCQAIEPSVRDPFYEWSVSTVGVGR